MYIMCYDKKRTKRDLPRILTDYSIENPCKFFDCLLQSLLNN